MNYEMVVFNFNYGKFSFFDHFCGQVLEDLFAALGENSHTE